MAQQAVETKPITEDDLLRLGAQDRRVEVVDGKLIIMEEDEMVAVGLLHVIVAGNVHDLLRAYVNQHDLGHVFMDGLICVLDRDEARGITRSRIPDTCFIRKGRIPADFDLRRPFPGAPDLAVEVVSPGDTAEETLAKVRDYLRFGAAQVWVLYPEQQEVHQYTHDSPLVRVYRNNDLLDTGALLPGLQVAASAFFVLPDLS